MGDDTERLLQIRHFEPASGFRDRPGMPSTSKRGRVCLHRAVFALASTSAKDWPMQRLATEDSE